MTAQRKGTLLVLICVALWALIPVVAKTGQATLDNHQFLFWSSVVSLAVLAASVAATGRWPAVKALRRRDWAYLLFLGLLGTYLYYLFLYLGYARAVGLEVLVFQYTWPALIVLFSLLILGERLTGRKAAALLLGFAGVLTVLTKGDFSRVDLSEPGVIALVVAGAACFALFSVLSKNVPGDPLVAVAVYFLAAALAALASMLAFSGFAWPARAELAPVLLNGVLVNGFSYVIWLAALRAAEASYLAPFVYLTPVLSALYLVLFFGEPFLAVYAVGLGCIVVGGVVNSAGEQRD